MFKLNLVINNQNQNKNINMLNRSNIIELIHEKINNQEIRRLAIIIYNKLENNEEISTDILINMLNSKKKFNNPFNNWSSNNNYAVTNNDTYAITNNDTNATNSTNSNFKFYNKKINYNSNNNLNNTSNSKLNSKFNINNYILNSRKPIKTNIKTVVREVVRGHPIFYEIYHSGNLFFKLYQFNDYMNYVNFILEITFQIYTYYILQKYLSKEDIILTTPKILKCYKTDKFNSLDFIQTMGNLSYQYILYIEMESAEGDTLKSISSQLKNNNCELVVNIIEYLDSSLKDYGIFHNDLNRSNIFIKKSSFTGKIVKITIIDFGQSLDRPHIDPRTQFKYNCNIKKGIVLKNRSIF